MKRSKKRFSGLSRYVYFTLIVALLAATVVVAGVNVGNAATAWTSGGVRPTSSSVNQNLPKLTSDGFGGTIVCWDETPTGGQKVYVQRVDSTGARKWGNTGKMVLSNSYNYHQLGGVVADGSGGAIVGLSAGTATTNKAYAQKIDASGNLKWTANGKDLAPALNNSMGTAIPAPDGTGGAILVWSANVGVSNTLIYAQRIDSNGNLKWGSSAKQVTNTAAQLTVMKIIPDGAGGAIIAFLNIPGVGGDTFLYGQRISPNGSSLWGPDGVKVTNETLLITAPNADLATDGSSGAIFTWDTWPPVLGSQNVHAQRIDKNGAIKWARNGVPVCNVNSERWGAQIASDQAGGCIVTWHEGRGDASPKVYAQRLNGSGKMLWSTNAIALNSSGGRQANDSLVSDNAGGAISFFRDTKYNKYGDWDLYAQRLDPSGQFLWPTPGTRVGIGGSQGWPPGQAISDGIGGAILAWDFGYQRPVPVSYILVQKVSTDYPTWYLAEGTNAWGFSTYITIENPNPMSVHAKITYMTTSGPVSGGTLTLPSMSQTHVNTADKVAGKDFSSKIECTEGNTIAVDRTMTWTGPGAGSEEAHSSVGVNASAKKWYLAEGSSAWGFECWLLIQNPNNKEAAVNLTYMIEGAEPIVKTKTVKANSRDTFNMEQDIGQHDASVMVDANVPVIPERAMYRNNRREGHESIGTIAPGVDYYLAEGTTDFGFTTYVLVQNPNSSPVDVTVTYMTPEGAKPQPKFQMPARSMKTIRVNDILSKTDVSTQVRGSLPIIAERAMYWNGGPDNQEACHDSIGMASSHTSFFLPDGSTSNGRETYTLVQNPNSTPVTVEITYMTTTGKGNTVFTDTLAKNSRKTFSLDKKITNGQAAIMVRSLTAGKGIMVERSMYWNKRGAGTDTIGGYKD